MEQNPFYSKGRGRMPQNGSAPPDAWPDVAGEPSYAVGFNRPAGPRKNQMEEVLDLLHHGKWIVLATFLLVLTGFAVYTYRIVPEYESAVLLLVHPRGSGPEDAMSFAGGSIFARNDRSLANELVVLRNSLSIARSVSHRLLDMKVIPGTATPLPLLGGIEGFEPESEDVARQLQYGRIRIAPEASGVDIIRLTAVSTMPEEAALLANVYAEEYVKMTRDASRARIQASRAFLERQEETRREELRAVEEQVKQYMSQNGAIALDNEGQLLVTQISQLEAQRDDARIELQTHQASLQSLENELTAIHPQLAQRVASGVEREIRQAQGKIAELEVSRQQIYLRNPDLRRDAAGDEQLRQINSQINALQHTIDVLSKQFVDEVLAVGGIDLSVEGGGLAQVADLNRQVVAQRIGISGLLAKIDVMDRRLEEHEVELRSLPDQVIQLAQLQRSRQAAERMYSNVVEKLQEARIAEESELGYADIIREALVPAAPVRPDKQRNLMMGAFMGLFLGIGLAIARKRLDNRIYSPEDLREIGGSVVGVIPQMDQMIKDDFAGNEYVEVEGRSFSTRLVMLLNPISHISEAYRQLRTNIQFSRPDTVVQTILVTSAGPGEGKTVTAANLALTMAQSGRRTVIVDADLRRPRLHDVLGLKRDPGLVELLFQEGKPDLERLATGIDNLYGVPAGRAVPNPAELLGSRRMRDLLDMLRSHFDVIIIDTPPVLVATDAALLSTQSDATLAVVTAASTRKEELEGCLDALGSVGAPVIGILLNRFEVAKAYGYSYKYGSYYSKYYSKYGYGYGVPEEKERKRGFSMRRKS